MEVFSELTTIILLATGISLIMRLLKQPLVVGYILTGLLSGEYFLNIIHAKDTIELFSKIGITILLFIVGLNLSPNVIKEVGKVSIATGIGQIVLTTGAGILLSLLLGLDKIAAIYVAIALTLSSTIVILKLLSDKGDLNSLYGKIAIGFLLVQDIFATIVLLVVSSFNGAETGNIFQLIALTIIKGSILTTVLLFVSGLLVPKLLQYVAHSQELLFLFSISWGLSISLLFAQLGFSIEIGALVAGVAIAATPYAFEVSSRLRPLRDFFILLFFIFLGSHMVLENLTALILPATILSLFVLIGNPLILIMITNSLGITKRTSFQAGMTTAQISEFSLILATLGFQVGHLSQEVLSLITLVGLITIAGSTYLIMYDHAIYPHVAPLLDKLQFGKKKKKNKKEKAAEILLFGYHRVGHEFIDAFSAMGKSFMVVDYSPESINDLKEQNIPYRFGDAQDPEFLEELNLKAAKMVVSTIPDFSTNQFLLKKIRHLNKKAIVILISHNTEQALELYKGGANYVLTPHYLGAQYAAKMIERLALDLSSFNEEKEKHLKYIHKHTKR